MTPPRSPTILPAWPVLIALGLVGALIAAMVGLDVLLGQRVADQTDHIVENAQRSIVLLDTIRTQAQNLSELDAPPGEAAARGTALTDAVHEYDGLATFEGERPEWLHLQDVLRQLSAAHTPAERSRASDEVDRSVDRLIAINSEGSRRDASAIHEAHRSALVDDTIVGVIALALTSVIALVLLRVLVRQRELIAERVEHLDAKTRDLEAFAARAAHDLRSPMNPIRGYADLLLEASESPDDVRMMATRIRTAVDRMARVVDDMLALSTAGRPAPGVCAPREVALAVLDELGPDLHGVQVTTELTASDVACSAGILHQLLRNLIGNAVKFRARSRLLELSITVRDAGACVDVAVEDNGLGMDAETAAHAFEPMYRGRADREVPGHGLGLAIVERTTRALGGTCQLTSAPDRGTRVVVHLPRA